MKFGKMKAETLLKTYHRKGGTFFMEEKKGKWYYGWNLVVVGFIIYAIVYSTTSTASIYTVSITEELGFGRSLWATKSIFACVGSLISCYVSGRLIQKYGLRKVMTISTIGVAATFFLPLSMTQIWQFYIVAIISAMTWCAATIMGVPIMINRWFGPKKKGLALSITLAGSGLGSMFMSPILSSICQNYGWRKAYIFDGCIILFLIAPLIYFTVVERPQDKGYTERLGEAPKTQKSSSFSIPYNEGKLSMAFFVVTLGIMMITMCNAGVTNHRTPYFTDLFGDAVKAASISGLAIGMLTPGKILLGMFCDKLGAKKGLLIGTLCYFGSILTLYLSVGNASLAYGYVAFYMIGGAVGTVALPLMVSAMFGDKDYGKYLGTIQSITTIGTPIGNIFFGRVFDKTGGYTGAWLVATVVALLVVVVIYMSFVIADKQRKKLAMNVQTQASNANA